MPREVQFAVVGLGIGMHHCSAVAEAKGARLAAVCDSDEDRLREAAARFGCKAYTDWSELLRDDDIDCVNICVESGKHGEFGIQAAKAGKHMLIEKPIEITLPAVRRLRQAVEKAGVKAGCIFQSRLDPLNIRFKKAIEKGKLGRLVGVHAILPWWRAQSYYDGPHGSWKGTWKLDGGGSLMNQGIHTVDLLQWLAGPVESVCGFHGVFTHEIEAEDQTVAILRFRNGALGTLATTTCCTPGKDQRIFLYGDKGCLSRHGSHLEFFDAGSEAERKRMMEAFGRRDSNAGVSSDPMAVSADGHTLQVEDMVKAIRTGREPLITIDSATHAVEIATAVFKSARTGRVEKVGS